MSALLVLTIIGLVPVPLSLPMTRGCAVQHYPPAMRAADERGSWNQRLRSTGTAIAAAVVLLTVPCPAFAAQPELSAPTMMTPIVRCITDERHQAKKPEAAFLGLRRKTTGTRPSLNIRPDRTVVEVPAKLAKRFTDRGFLFSASLTEQSELEVRHTAAPIASQFPAHPKHVRADHPVTSCARSGPLWCRRSFKNCR